jgi:tRNA pseudouridine55 synthase
MEKAIINRSCLAEKISRESDHLILIDKPADWSSFDVVKKVRNIGSFKKVGHAGTLDPFATGLLILGTGRFTKSLSQISAKEKAYFATIAFGTETDTYDVAGTMLEENTLEMVDIYKVQDAVSEFIGESEQVPPMYSAKKVKGKRLYKLARKGITVDREAQKINIYQFDVVSQDGASVNFFIRCSKGTYIRTLAHDLGIKTGYGAYLKALRRILIDGYHVDDAITIEEFQHYWRGLN